MPSPVLGDPRIYAPPGARDGGSPGGRRPGVWQRGRVDSSPVDVDLALVGGGGAASLVLAALDRHGLTGLRVAVVDPVHKRGQDRTWAFWGSPGNDLDPLLSASWSRVEVVTPAGRRVLSLAPLRYAMLRSAPVYDRAAEAERRLGATRIDAPAGTLRDDGDAGDGARPDGRALVRAGWVLDSRPRPPARPGRTTWLQHFRGWWLEADRPAFDPDAGGADGLPHPAAAPGVSPSATCCRSATGTPWSSTPSSRRPCSTDAGYDAALRGYRDLLGLDPAGLRVREVENGVIPMTDGPFVGPALAPGGPARHRRRRHPAVHRVHLLRDAPPGRPGGRGARGGPAAGARAGVPAPAPVDGRGGAAGPGPGRRSAGRSSSTGCSTATRPSGCCASSTGPPPRPRTWR